MGECDFFFLINKLIFIIFSRKKIEKKKWLQIEFGEVYHSLHHQELP